MTVLTKSELLKYITKKKIKISPFKRAQVGPGSIDLTLDNKFRIFKKRKTPIDLTSETDYQKYTKEVIQESIVIKPGELILGITREQVTLDTNLCALLEGRSRFARLGLVIHITAGFMQPGINNHQVLELFNASKHPLRLHAGEKVCQLIVMTTKGRARYVGKFSRQKKA